MKMLYFFPLIVGCSFPLAESIYFEYGYSQMRQDNITQGWQKEGFPSHVDGNGWWAATGITIPLGARREDVIEKLERNIELEKETVTALEGLEEKLAQDAGPRFYPWQNLPPITPRKQSPFLPYRLTTWVPLGPQEEVSSPSEDLPTQLPTVAEEEAVPANWKEMLIYGLGAIGAAFGAYFKRKAITGLVKKALPGGKSNDTETPDPE